MGKKLYLLHSLLCQECHLQWVELYCLPWQALILGKSHLLRRRSCTIGLGAMILKMNQTWRCLHEEKNSSVSQMILIQCSRFFFLLHLTLIFNANKEYHLIYPKINAKNKTQHVVLSHSDITSADALKQLVRVFQLWKLYRTITVSCKKKKKIHFISI